MADFVVIMYQDGKATEKHLVRTPRADQPGFYRQAVSFDAFRTGENKRLLSAHRSGLRDVVGKRASADWADEYQVMKESIERCMRKYDPSFVYEFDKLPFQSHNSVWDFYQAIGYDYKKKKYTS